MLSTLAPGPNSNPVHFRGCKNLSAGNNHAQTPCPRNRKLRGCTIQTSSIVNQSYATTVIHTSDACPDDPQQNPNQKPGNKAPG